MKHLPDLLTLRQRHPLFHSSVCSSVCPSVNSSVMLKFDSYVKVSILINYKTKQPSNLAWNISLASWLCNIGICFSVCPSVCLSMRLSTFMSKFDISVKVSILINYKTKQPSNLAWNISLTSWLCDIGICFSVHPSICLSIRLSTFMSKFDISVKVSTVKPVLVVTSIKQPTCIKQPEESCPKIHIPIYLNCIKQPPAFSSQILSFPWVAA